MPRHKINLATLSNRQFSSKGRIPPASDFLPGLDLSRRKFLGVAGFAAIGGFPFNIDADTTSSESFDIIEEPNRVAFILRGQERWVINTKSFAGRPLLKIDKTESHIRIELTGATYPGTDLSADLCCDLNCGKSGWRMRLSLSLCDFVAEAPFVEWLSGLGEARTDFDSPGLSSRFGKVAQITFSGRITMKYCTDGSVHMSGVNIAKLTGLTDLNKQTISVTEIVSSLAILSLSLEGSLLSNPSRKRSVIRLDRGRQVWALAPSIENLKGWAEGWKIEFDDNSFDLLQIEISESARGDIRFALLADSTDQHDTCRFRASTDDSVEPLTLRNPRFAAVFDSSGCQGALLADIGDSPARLRAGDYDLWVGGGVGVEPFQIIFSNGRVDKLIFAPALHEANAPLPGVITRAVSLPDNMRLDLSGSSAERSSLKQLARVRFDQHSAQGWVEIPVTAVEIVRPEDLLALRFEFVNLFLRTSVKKPSFFCRLFGADDKRDTQLVRMDGRRPAYIIAQFPPQNIVERAFFQASEDIGCDIPGRDDQLCSPPILSRISGPSRLVFRIPDEIQTIPYTLDELLSWSKFELSVSPTAQPLGETTSSKIQEPYKTETAIELPYRLTLSPNHLAGWAHSVAPVIRPTLKTATGKIKGESPSETQLVNTKPLVNWIELWHTRLAVRGEPGEPGSPGTIDEENEYYRTLRAIWSPDVGLNSRPDLCAQPEQTTTDPCDLFRTAMNAGDRYEIVQLTSNFNELQENKGDGRSDNWIKLDPIPIKVKRLMLSSLGGWLDSNAGWPEARRKEEQGSKIELLSVRGWSHLATMGRDHYVKIVYGGYLYPFGHRASLIQITERKFQRKDAKSPITAYLRQRIYLKVEQETMAYGNASDVTINRQMTFRSITIKTAETPSLDRPENSSIANQGKCAFWPQVCGKKFLFHLVKVDAAGITHECDAPAIFVIYENRFNKDVMKKVVEEYQEAPESNCDLNGQKIAFVVPKEPGDTTYETRTIRFSGIVPFLKAAGPQTLAANIAAAADACSLPFEPPLPPWNAVVEQATVKIPALEQILGSAQDVPITWDQNYVQNGLDAAGNAGEVFAKIADDKIKLSLPDTRSVGLVKPELNVQALSRRFGSVGEGFESLANGTFDSDALLQNVEAKILGVFNLIDIIHSGQNFVAGDGRIVPKIATRTIFDNDGLPAAVESRMEWQPKLKEHTETRELPIVKFTPHDESGFSLRLATQTNLKAGGATTYDVRCELHTFNVEIIQAVIIQFDRLVFVSSSGQKPNVDVSLANPPVIFREALAFVQDLQSRIPGLKGLKIDVNGGVVTASLAIAIPNITIGVISMLNMRFAIQLHLPLKGDTPFSLRFSFGEPSDPFLVAVTFLGGGGYFVTKLSLHGIELFMVGIEFGGVLALDIAIASGKVYVFAGFRFVYEKDGPNKGVTLTGYLRCGGELDILGIISLSVEFFLGLSYRSSDGKIWGIARVTVTISILFFSKDVELTVEREFSGSRESNALAFNAATRGLPSDASHRAPTFEELMGRGEWHDYCAAFKTGI